MVYGYILDARDGKYRCRAFQTRGGDGKCCFKTGWLDTEAAARAAIRGMIREANSFDKTAVSR